MSRLCSTLLLLLLISAGSAYGQESSRALVVGIERYVDGRVNTGAVASAQAYATLLRDHLGVPAERMVVLLNEEATRERILSELARLSASPEKERVYVYVAARSVTRDRGLNTRGYLLPFDGEVVSPDSVRGGIALPQLRLTGAGATRKEALFVLDMPVGGIGGTYPRVPEKGRPDTLAVQHVLVAGRAGETAPSQEESALIRALRAGIASGKADAGGNGLVSTQELAGYVQRMVPALSGNALHPQFRALTRAPGFLEIPVGTDAEEPWMRPAVSGVVPPEGGVNLAVKSNMADVNVLVDGLLVGVTPASMRALEGHYGEASIVLSKEGYHAREIVVDVQPGDYLEIEAPLTLITGTLVLEDLPAGAQIFIDGKEVLANPEGTYALAPGEHVIAAQIERGKRVRRTIEVMPEGERRLAYQVDAFSAKPAKRNMFMPGIGQLRRGYHLKGSVILGSTVLFIGFAGVNQLGFQSANREYQSAIDAYEEAFLEAEVVARWDEMVRQYDRTRQRARLRDTGLTLAAVAWAYNVADLLLFHSRVPALVPQRSARPVQTTFRVAPAPAGVTGSLAFQF